MPVGALIAIMVGIAVGVSFIPTIMDAVNQTKAEQVAQVPTSTTPATGVILDVLLYIFIAVIIWAAVAWIGFGRHPWQLGRGNLEFGRANSPKLFEELSQYAEKFGGLSLVTKELSFSTRLNRTNDREPLSLSQDRLSLHHEFAWFPVDKSEKHLMYKLVGLDKRGSRFNANYLIGRDSHTNSPYALRLPPNYINRTLEDSVAWCIQMNNGNIPLTNPSGINRL